MKFTPKNFIESKGQTPIAMLTAYTTPVAKYLEQAGIPIILVGDSVGMVEMGFKSTREVTIDHMRYHIGAVRRGAPNTHIIGDMPYNTDTDPETAEINARLLIGAGADSIKLEGPKYDVIKYLRDQDIEVVGHTGLTPQTSANFKQVGGNRQDADRIVVEARGIESAGAFMMVLEHIPRELARDVTATVGVPTIGIGAGPFCDGQVLVVNDAIGMGDYWPPFSRQFAHVGKSISGAVTEFRAAVEGGYFPGQA